MTDRQLQNYVPHAEDCALVGEDEEDDELLLEELELDMDRSCERRCGKHLRHRTLSGALSTNS